MNALRELNVAELAQIEGGDHTGDPISALVEALEALFTSILIEPLAALITGAAEAFFDFLASLFSGNA